MKKSCSQVHAMYPVLTVILGTKVNGKPTFSTVSHIGLLDLQSLSISIRKEHYTNTGIAQNGTFSVNIPSVDLIREVDYCGSHSGRNEDKSNLFDVFYANYESAPMVKSCPVNIECRVVGKWELPLYYTYFAQIVETFCEDDCITDGHIDLAKVQPFFFSTLDMGYWNLGRRVSDAWFPYKSLVKNKID